MLPSSWQSWGLWSSEKAVKRLLGRRVSQFLGGYKFGSGNLVEGGIDNVKVVNLWGSLDKACQRLQHVWVSLRVVSLGIGLIFPQTDCGHINSARTSESDFVLEAMLFTKQRKDVFFKCSRVIGEHVGFQMDRNIACIHGQPPRVGVAK